LWLGLLAALTVLHMITCSMGSHTSAGPSHTRSVEAMTATAHMDMPGPAARTSSHGLHTLADQHPEPKHPEPKHPEPKHPEHREGCTLAMAPEPGSHLMPPYAPVLSAGWTSSAAGSVHGEPVTKTARHALGHGLRRPSLSGVSLLNILCESRT
jgi:hypothetical protein